MAMFQFKGYRLRPALLGDLALAQQWTAADPDHAGRVDPKSWITQSELTQSYILEDAEGPIFFFKGELELQWPRIVVHIQFPPDDRPNFHHRRRQRVSQGLIEGLAWLEERMAGAVNEIVFESSTPALVRFSIRHLGFKLEDGKLRKPITLNQPIAGV